MEIKIERDTFEELAIFKLQHLQNLIRSIIDKWKQDNSDDFITKARSGELENAEMDAISIRQLLADYNRLKKLMIQLSLKNKNDIPYLS